MVALGRDADLGEGLQPRPDARFDRVDERAIQVEDDCTQIGQLSEPGQRRLRMKTNRTTTPMAIAARIRASSTSLPLPVG